MHLGLSMRFLGYHSGAWRHPEIEPNGPTSFQAFADSARKAEEAKFDLVFFADGLGIRTNDEPPGSLCRSGHNAELEPITLLSALAPVTKRIGLISTASTTYNEPFHVARKFGSLDLISNGRAGWNVVTSWSEQEAWNFNRSEHLAYDERYERAKEFVQVVTGLWDTWDKDAFVYDKSNSIYFDDKKWHVLDHRGKHFSVRGPLNLNRSRQGRPILVQAGTNAVGQEIAARHCDLVFSSHQDLGSAQEYYSSVKGRLAQFGRSFSDLHILTGLTTVVGKTKKEAEEKFEYLKSLVDPQVGMALLYNTLGDLSHLPLDGSVPEPDYSKIKMRSSAESVWKMAKNEGLSIRQLCQKVGMSMVHRIIVGTPEEVADHMETWMDNGAADGFNVTPTHLPHALDDFAKMVLPILRERGRFREDYEGETLRENLQLSIPVNRYSTNA
jgi:FMN-dependent oxidoreductase (nitrilotriacetate monooxygenase family)